MSSVFSEGVFRPRPNYEQTQVNQRATQANIMFKSTGQAPPVVGPVLADVPQGGMIAAISAR